MTAQDYINLLGKKYNYNLGFITIEVTILDIRHAFGRTDVLIEPISGQGKKWVALDSVRCLL